MVYASHMSPKPLLVREGARYACFSDGLCCTDAHALGPVTAEEATRLPLLVDSPTQHHGALDIEVLRTLHRRCVFLRADNLCGVHAQSGAAAKPQTCQQFPFGLVATPSGMRVTTEHRCPCRTLGERPLLTEDDVAHLFDVTASADHEVGTEVAWAESETISFLEYQTRERELIRRLLAGEEAVAVLEATPFPPLAGLSWTDTAHLFRALLDGTTCGDALATFGDVVLGLVSSYRGNSRSRTWAASFDRAEARTASEIDPQILLNDFVADALWSLAWDGATFAQARAELATRVCVANTFAAALTQSGVRADRAMAEAILVVELAGASSLWRRLVLQLEVV